MTVKCIEYILFFFGMCPNMSFGQIWAPPLKSSTSPAVMNFTEQCCSWANHGMGHFPFINNKLEISMGHSL